MLLMTSATPSNYPMGIKMIPFLSVIRAASPSDSRSLFPTHRLAACITYYGTVGE